MRLKDKHILLGISGSIAAYKAPELIRLLQENGASVQVMTTSSALRFVTPLTLEAISGFPVLKDIFENGFEMSHIQSTRKADLILIAPATANIIAKLTYGLADDIVTATVLAAKVPVLVAPAMNSQMWNNSLLQRNVKQLKSAGYLIVQPGVGALACGEFGEGRLADLTLILHEVIKNLTPQDFKGKTILISGGATREYLDPVRFLSNASSGRMASALVQEAYTRGAKVIFIPGHQDFFTLLPRDVVVKNTISAEEMKTAVFSFLPKSHVFISAAAVSDYTFVETHSVKLKKHLAKLSLPLKPAEDILKSVLLLKKRPFVVGFALETQNLIQAGLKKFSYKPADLLVLNSIQAIASEKAKVSFISSDGVKSFPLLDKEKIATKIFDFLSSFKQN